jgi:hypothetical protein
VYAEANQQAAASSASGQPSADGGETDEVVEDADYEVIDEDETAKTS